MARSFLLRRITTIAVLWCLFAAPASLSVAALKSRPALPSPAGTARAAITIHASQVAGPISPLLYGQFLEHMFEGVKFGLHAELLRDRGFDEQPDTTGLSRAWERYPDNRNDDYALTFTSNDAIRYPPPPADGPLGGLGPEKAPPDTGVVGHSLRADVSDGVVSRHGIFQSRIPVRAGVEYRGYLWVKSGGFQGRLALALESDVLGGPTYAETRVGPVKGDWRKYEFRLRPNQSDPLARFVVLFEGVGRLWLDQVSLLPGNAVDGVRPDVFARIKGLRPAFIRWPGGNVAQDYHWRWGIGPRDERPAWINLSWKNEIEPSDFGTGEFIALSRNAGAEPSITVNVEGRGATAAEAAAWVEYCNGAITTEYGAMRAADGHPVPYNVKLWEIGNEVWGAWVRGHSDAATYARNFNRYAEAMRKVDPAIKLIAVGDNDMNWNREVLSTAGANLDYLAIHHYYGRREMAGQLSNLMLRPLFYEGFYRQVRALINELSPQRTIGLAINEWGLDLPVEQQDSMVAALYGARLMNVFERSDGLVAMSAVSDLVNGWPGGIIQAGRHGLFVSPLYLVNQIYSESLGTERVETEVTGPGFDSIAEGGQAPVLDVVASRRRAGRRLVLKAVNTAPERALVTTIRVPGARVLPQAEMAIVNAASLKSYNSFATPQAVHLTNKHIVAGANFQVTLPPHSVSVLTLRLAR